MEAGDGRGRRPWPSWRPWALGLAAAVVAILAVTVVAGGGEGERRAAPPRPPGTVAAPPGSCIDLPERGLAGVTGVPPVPRGTRWMSRDTRTGRIEATAAVPLAPDRLRDEARRWSSAVRVDVVDAYCDHGWSFLHVSAPLPRR
jgi:hypothetical protein